LQSIVAEAADCPRYVVERQGDQTNVEIALEQSLTWFGFSEKRPKQVDFARKAAFLRGFYLLLRYYMLFASGLLSMV
jgi:hypothetical protein